MARRLTILAFDPGKINMGFCVIRYNGKRYKIIKIGMFSQAINSLLQQQFAEQSKIFNAAIKKLIKQYQPDRIIAERFLNRGRFFGGTSELVGVMLGIIWGLANKYKIPLLLTTAAAWKNQFHRHTTFKLKQLYQQMKPLPPHCVDSGLIAVFGITKIDTYIGWQPRFFKKAHQQWIRALVA